MSFVVKMFLLCNNNRVCWSWCEEIKIEMFLVKVKFVKVFVFYLKYIDMIVNVIKVFVDKSGLFW